MSRTSLNERADQRSVFAFHLQNNLIAKILSRPPSKRVSEILNTHGTLTLNRVLGKSPFFLLVNSSFRRMSSHANYPPDAYYHLMPVLHVFFFSFFSLLNQKPGMHNKAKINDLRNSHNAWANYHFSLCYLSSFMHAYRQCCCCCCCCCLCFFSSSFLFPHASPSSMSLGAHLSKINKWLHALFTALVPRHSSQCTRLIFPGWKAGVRWGWGEQRE